jgi:peptide/nickel transport system substrate-binding protein
MRGRPGVKIVESPSVSLALAYLNCTKPPLDNVKVRQAMNYAINYDAFVKDLLQGKGRRLKGPLAYGMEGYDESLKGYDCDPAKAKALLAEAGFPNGFELQLTYATQGAAGADDIVLTAQSNLADIGIRVNIEKVAEPTRRERIDKSDFAWSVGGWSPPMPIVSRQLPDASSDC